MTPATQRLFEAAKNMDWMQVVLNGGPPCFHIEDDGRFCGRAERWHDKSATEMFHAYLPLDALIAALEAEDDGWIDVKDQAFPNSDSAICRYHVEQSIMLDIGTEYTHELWCDRGFWAWGAGDSEDVEPVSGIVITHWRPLPAPPSAEKAALPDHDKGDSIVVQSAICRWCKKVISKREGELWREGVAFPTERLETAIRRAAGELRRYLQKYQKHCEIDGNGGPRYALQALEECLGPEEKWGEEVYANPEKMTNQQLVGCFASTYQIHSNPAIYRKLKAGHDEILRRLEAVQEIDLTEVAKKYGVDIR